MSGEKCVTQPTVNLKINFICMRTSFLVDSPRITDDSISILISIVFFPPCAVTYNFSPNSLRHDFPQYIIFCMQVQQYGHDQRKTSSPELNCHKKQSVKKPKMHLLCLAKLDYVFLERIFKGNPK